MRVRPWQKIIAIVLVVTILFGASGCQSKVGQELGNSIHSFTQIGGNLESAVTNLMHGLNNIGSALADQVNNIVRGMTHH